jgi:CubicO group peptidase (beta-lactamase class C family)
MTDSTWTNHDPNKVFAFTWQSTVLDMARVGLLILHDGVWSDSRLLSADWTYKMTHPSFEDANTAYGYLTWVNSDSNHTQGLTPGLPKQQGPIDACAPASVWPAYPHGLSESPDCNYDPPYTCADPLDVGMWFAAGLGGQFIVGHRALDLVLVVKNSPRNAADLWADVRPALVAFDPQHAGDEAGFCADYAAGAYAPDLL